jgi:hypothetical protein
MSIPLAAAASVGSSAETICPAPTPPIAPASARRFVAELISKSGQSPSILPVSGWARTQSQGALSPSWSYIAVTRVWLPNTSERSHRFTDGRSPHLSATSFIKKPDAPLGLVNPVSIRLVVATSLSASQSSCAARMLTIRAWLSEQSSASMSRGSTFPPTDRSLMNGTFLGHRISST